MFKTPIGVVASLRFEKRLKFSINPRKLSIFYRSFSNRSEALNRAKIEISVGVYNIPRITFVQKITS